MPKSVSMTDDDQVEAFENAKELVREDNGELVDCDTWGDDVTDGEVVRVLAEAYTGTL